MIKTLILLHRFILNNIEKVAIRKESVEKLMPEVSIKL
jgi:hypothetical protein